MAKRNRSKRTRGKRTRGNRRSVRQPTRRKSHGAVKFRRRVNKNIVGGSWFSTANRVIGEHKGMMKYRERADKYEKREAELAAARKKVAEATTKEELAAAQAELAAITG